MIVSITNVFGQSHQSNELTAVIGWKSMLLDYAGGPRIGLEYSVSSWKFGIYHDTPFRIGKSSVNATQSLYSNEDFKLLYFKTMDYFQAGYSFSVLSSKTSFNMGVGWIYRGLKENVFLNQDYGYLVGTISLEYAFDWLNVELRGDIPLKDKYMREYGSIQGRAFPVSVALTYSIKPRKST